MDFLHFFLFEQDLIEENQNVLLNGRKRMLRDSPIC